VAVSLLCGKSNSRMNYFFLDASALAKRYVVEIGTPLINHLFNTVPKRRMTALILALGEIVSILVRRRNDGRISTRAFRQAMAEFRVEIAEASDFLLQSASDDLVRMSLALIERHSLNATDAVILGCALQIAQVLRATDDDLILVTSDARLATAAEAAGLLTWNPEKTDQESLEALIAAGS